MPFFIIKINRPNLLSIEENTFNNIDILKYKWLHTLEILQNEQNNGRIIIGGVLKKKMQILFIVNCNNQDLQNLLLNLPISNYSRINIQLLNKFGENLNELNI